MKTAQNDMEEAGGRECEGSRVEDRMRWRKGVRVIAEGMRCI